MTREECQGIAGRCYVNAASRLAAHDHGTANEWSQAGKAIEFLMQHQKKTPGRKPRLEGADASDDT